MKKIILSDVLVSLEGEELKDPFGSPMTVGNSIARALIQTETKDPMRSYVLAQELYIKEEIELNSSDLQYITDQVKASKIYTPLVLGQVLSKISTKSEE